MTWVAVAIGGSALVGAGAAAYTGNKAAGAAQGGANASINEQARQYDQTRTDFASGRSLYDGANAQLAREQGFFDPKAYLAANPDVAADPWASQNAAEHYQRFGVNENRQGTNSVPQSGFTQSPGYTFALEQQQKAIERAGAAGGRFDSGRQALELQRNAVGNANQGYGDYINRLFTSAGLGNSSVSQTANAGANMANNNSSAILNAANTRASTYNQTGQAINGAVQGGIQGYMLQQYLKK